MGENKLEDAIAKHIAWLSGESGGKIASITWVDLTGANSFFVPLVQNYRIFKVLAIEDIDITPESCPKVLAVLPPSFSYSSPRSSQLPIQIKRRMNHEQK